MLGAAGSSTPVITGPTYWCTTCWGFGMWAPLAPLQAHLRAWVFLLSSLCLHSGLHHRLLVSSYLCHALFSSRFPFGADAGQRDPGSELLLQLHPDEAESLLCSGWGQPRGPAHWTSPPHGLQCQRRCLLLLYLLLGGWPWLHPLHAQWTLGAGREGTLFSFPFFFIKKNHI